MIRRPPGSTRTDTLFPYPTLFRSRQRVLGERGQLLAHRLAGGLDASFEQLHRLAVAARHHLATTEHISPADRDVVALLQLLQDLGADAVAQRRSEERRVGQECVSTCPCRWSQYP